MFDDLKSRWNLDRCLNTPASEIEIRDWEMSKGLSLPTDFRTYLLELNGTDDTGDRDLFEFYPLSKLQSWQESNWKINEDTPHDFRSEDWLILGDYSLTCHAYAIYVGANQEMRSRIAICGGLKYAEIASSFKAFIELYLADGPKIQPQPSPADRAYASANRLFQSQFTETWLERLTRIFRGTKKL